MSEVSINLSVVAPVYNERENLIPLTTKIMNALSGKVIFEIVYIDDGSIDGSQEILDQLAEENKEVRVFHFYENNGQTAAFIAGFSRAEGKLIATMDSDLQVEPEDILKLHPYIKDYDMVVGIRENRQDNFIKKVSSQIGNGVRNFLTNEEIEDTGCPLKLFKRELTSCFYPFTGMHRFFPTLARMNGYSVTEVPVKHYSRKYGKSKYGIRNRIWKGLLDTFAVRWMQHRKINYRIKGEED